MKKVFSAGILSIIVVFACAGGISAKELVVGVKETPPFVMKDSGGNWQGISIRLWEDIADELDYEYRIVERDLDGLLEGLEGGSIDVGVAAITITSEREKVLDFTHSFYNTGLGIAVNPGGLQGWIGAGQQLLSMQFIKAVLALVVVLFIAGLVLWLFERKKNEEEFGGGAAKGLWSAFWWSAVTMTTVGYGDKAPKSIGGRIVALIWMFAAIITISSFTAAIASVLTVSHLESSIKGPQDLHDVRVGAVKGTTASAYLERKGITFKGYEKPIDCLVALANDEVDAAVHDIPILQYLTNTRLEGSVEVLPVTFERQDYGFGLQGKSILREDINRVLLKKLREPHWRETLRKYLGEKLLS
ncbi:MAG: transporter substrate-binding domain-containing protein [candidate division Zixibacteria bacterium]|nr:transporter substrate-binding domain-containing protein [candidate division Zixibacteria bacterium]